MKTKIGFVSNSSTCSFVILGVKIDRKEPIARYWYSEQYYEDQEAGLLNGISAVINEDSIIIGTEIARIYSEDWGARQVELDLTEAISCAEAIKARFKLDGQLKLYTGIESC